MPQHFSPDRTCCDTRIVLKGAQAADMRSNSKNFRCLGSHLGNGISISGGQERPNRLHYEETTEQQAGQANSRWSNFHARDSYPLQTV
jgi:hypothetical protein